MRINERSREVYLGERPIHLTRKEFDLLYVFARHEGQILSRRMLLEEVWGQAFDGSPSTVTVHVRRLRKKIESDPGAPRHILTVWGVGYRFQA